MPRQASLEVEVFDASGRHVRTLATAPMGVGVHPLAWNLADDRGRRVDPGLYLVRLRTAGVQLTRKLLVVR